MPRHEQRGREHASFVVVFNESTPEVLVIRDLKTGQSITNDAQHVLNRLTALLNGRRLLYYDSDGHLDEILHRDGFFAGFAPGPNRAWRKGAPHA